MFPPCRRSEFGGLAAAQLSQVEDSRLRRRGRSGAGGRLKCAAPARGCGSSGRGGAVWRAAPIRACSETLWSRRTFLARRPARALARHWRFCWVFGYGAVTGLSFTFGLLAVLLAYLISRVSKIQTTLAMVLAGVMISSLLPPVPPSLNWSPIRTGSASRHHILADGLSGLDKGARCAVCRVADPCGVWFRCGSFVGA